MRHVGLDHPRCACWLSSLMSHLCDTLFLFKTSHNFSSTIESYFIKFLPKCASLDNPESSVNTDMEGNNTNGTVEQDKSPVITEAVILD